MELAVRPGWHFSGGGTFGLLRRKERTSDYFELNNQVSWGSLRSGDGETPSGAGYRGRNIPGEDPLIRKIEFRESVPAFAWRKSVKLLRKTIISTHDRGSIIGGPVYCKSDALYYAATKRNRTVDKCLPFLIRAMMLLTWVYEGEGAPHCMPLQGPHIGLFINLENPHFDTLSNNDENFYIKIIMFSLLFYFYLVMSKNLILVFIIQNIRRSEKGIFLSKKMKLLKSEIVRSGRTTPTATQSYATGPAILNNIGPLHFINKNLTIPFGCICLLFSHCFSSCQNLKYFEKLAILILFETGGTSAPAPEEETGDLDVWVVGLTTSTLRESRLMFQVFNKYPSPSDLLQ
uniref:(California timema) hypothetical protein n=1 Tax=Timema californicum TaxID=61474 RepID=A0A7R9P4W7_TIMCA|nr:unnamed protein product [Timema californicum]